MEPFPPTSTEHSENNSLTALQRHVEFFDRNKDGVIYPGETYSGFRAIGVNVPLSLLGATLINVGLSRRTIEVSTGVRVPWLRFPIYIKNINRAIHGNDSGVYDEAGRFVPERFEELFRDYAQTYPDRLSLKEINKMRSSFHRDSSSSGKFGSMLEWRFMHDLLKDHEGFVNKEELRRVYDGSIFYHLEEKEKERKKKKQGKQQGRNQNCRGKPYTNS